MKPFCQYCFNDPVTHLQQKELCGTCEMETEVAKRKMTNADKLRAMTDEELAEWLTLLVWGENREINYILGCTVEKWLEWLQKECE